MTLRKHIFGLLAAGAVAMSAGCTNGQIDPAVVVADIKAACKIAVPVADVVSIINAGVGLTAQGIVNIVCSGFAASQAASNSAAAAATPAGEVDFPVVVNGKTVTVHATRQ